MSYHLIVRKIIFWIVFGLEYSTKVDNKSKNGDTSNSGNIDTKNESQKLTNLINQFKIFNKAYRDQLLSFIKSQADKEDFELHYTPKNNNETDPTKNQTKVIVLKSKANGGSENSKSKDSN